MNEERAACMQIKVGIRALRAVNTESREADSDGENAYSLQMAEDALDDLSSALDRYERGVSHD